MHDGSLPRCTGGVGGTGNRTRRKRDRPSEIHLETDTVARSACLGMRVPVHAPHTTWYNVDVLRGLAPSVN